MTTTEAANKAYHLPCRVCTFDFTMFPKNMPYISPTSAPTIQKIQKKEAHDAKYRLAFTI